MFPEEVRIAPALSFASNVNISSEANGVSFNGSTVIDKIPVSDPPFPSETV